jgi:diguanylate cyclase (GGDEF)-like protein/PAS domain S-box-containing protein
MRAPSAALAECLCNGDSCQLSIPSQRTLAERTIAEERAIEVGGTIGLAALGPILDAIAQPVLVIDLASIILHWNPAAADLYGYTAAEAVGRSAIELLNANDDAPGLEQAATQLLAGLPWTGEIESSTREGMARTLLVTLTPLKIDTTIDAVIATSVDVTAAVADRQRLVEALALVELTTGELEHQALHDSLTGLPNRALILDRAEQMLARSRRHHTAAAALFIDLDNFKDINDSLGHSAGDELLQAVSRRFTAALRDSDTLGRLGGDEFVVVVEGSSLDAGAEQLAERLLDVLREPFALTSIDGQTRLHAVTATVGIAEGDRVTAEELLRDADLAMYRAKAGGRNRYTLFSADMQTSVQERLALEADLRAALDRDQFFLEYQPVFGLSDIATIGVEALLRWRHPTRGVVAPLDFIEKLEESGLILPVGGWVLNEACRQGAAWHEAGIPLSIAVNVSARQLESPTFLGVVATALADSGLSSTSLTIEITESVLMRDAAAAVETLAALKATGVRVAIDDFGTGYSSLAYLRQFPVDVLKIDRSFIAGMTESHEGGAVLHTLIQLGKQLGIQTIAEGIETDEQLLRLQTQDCDVGQGFLVAKPMSADDVVAHLTRNNEELARIQASRGKS